MATKLQLILAQNLKRARVLRGFSQAVLAEKSGVSTAFIGELEICRKFPSLDTLENIAGALKLEAFELLLDIEAQQDSSFYRTLWKDKLLAKISVAINETLPEYPEKNPE